MSTDDNKQIFLRVIREVINNGDRELAAELIDENFQIRRGGLQTTAGLMAGGSAAISSQEMSSLEGFMRGLTMMLQAFPDFQLEIDEASVVAQDDTVAGIWTLEGTHDGPFLGIEPTGNRVLIEEAGLMRFAGGKMVEGWFLVDELAFLAALGAVSLKTAVNA
ncbi:MAG TPA: ester cyclase [Solirubrobacteraceae bacterium]|nr:ester cyclase [Solirubrobacteraceae bacterium]